MKIILLLQSRKSGITVDYLSEYFGVSRRTIFRDFRFIQEMEVPYSFEEGVGYSIPRGYSIPPLMFTDKELSVISIGLSFIKSQPDSGMVESAKSVQLKIENVIPSEFRTLMATLENHIIVDPFATDNSPKHIGADWYAISNAIASNSKIQFNYRDSSVVRVVEPYFLIYFKDHWNIIGFDESKKAFRNFRLERIRNLVALKDYFTRDVTITPNEVLFDVPEEGHLIEVLVNQEILTDFIRTVPAKISAQKHSRNNYLCSFKFDNLDNLNVILLRYANHINLLSPNVLVDKRRDLLAKMMGDISSRN